MISDNYSSNRNNVLGHLRERWGAARKSTETDEKNKSHHLESFLMPFLEIADIEEGAIETISREPTEPHIRQMMEHFRKLKTNKWELLQQPPPKPGTGDPATANKRREMMLEIASAHFRKGMGSWMSSVAADHDVNATPIEELETLHGEAAYRLKVLNSMIAMMEREVDTLDSQIKAKQAQAAKAAAEAAANPTPEPPPA